MDISIPISKQKGYNNQYGRYWTKPVLELNGKHYIICSQWFDEFRDRLNKWINEQNTKPFNNKMDVYVLSKSQYKICPKCKRKTKREILYITYSTPIANINNKLFTRRCNDCGRTYIADTIFKSYTRSKDIERINVNFIRQDT